MRTPRRKLSGNLSANPKPTPKKVATVHAHRVFFFAGFGTAGGLVVIVAAFGVAAAERAQVFENFRVEDR